MIQVYTGKGKGKTTAALGLALRAVGAGKKVYICQFLKGRYYCELASLKQWNIKRGVQEGIISINGDSIEFKINKDYPLTVTDLNQDCNITTKVDPNLYYENSPVPNPDSGSNWHWYDTFGVVAGSIVGTGVLAVLGRFAYLKYCQQGGATLLNAESIDRSLLDSVNIE